MTSSSNKILKFKNPIKNVVILNSENSLYPQANLEFEEGIGQAVMEEKIRIPKSQYKQELESSYIKGLEEGESKGYQQAEAELKDKFESVLLIFQNLEKDRSKIIQQSENMLIELALKIVEKIVPEIPEIFPKILIKTLENIIQYLNDEPIFTLHLHPEDLQDIEELQNKFRKRLPGLEKISIKKDPKIIRGGCIVETENGKIDARIDSQVNKLTQGLRKELKRLPV
jgi:flagellar assembly protein FliH